MLFSDGVLPGAAHLPAHQLPRLHRLSQGWPVPGHPHLAQQETNRATGRPVCPLRGA